jgi:hypothetical protein
MRRSIFAVVVAAAGLIVPTSGRADDAPASRVRIEDRGPNRLLLATGIATLGFSYSVSAYIGATSPRESERFLLVPAVGPFIALAERDPCASFPSTSSSTSAVPSSVPCDREPTYQGLLIASGAMQLAGIAQIALAFVTRERRETERPLVMPLAVRGGAGIGASTTF